MFPQVVDLDLHRDLRAGRQRGTGHFDPGGPLAHHARLTADDPRDAAGKLVTKKLPDDEL